VHRFIFLMFRFPFSLLRTRRARRRQVHSPDFGPCAFLIPAVLSSTLLFNSFLRSPSSLDCCQSHFSRRVFFSVAVEGCIPPFSRDWTLTVLIFRRAWRLKDPYFLSCIGHCSRFPFPPVDSVRAPASPFGQETVTVPPNLF